MINSTNDEVAEHYENWPFPLPIPDLQPLVDRGYAAQGDPGRFALRYWPDGKAPKPMDILGELLGMLGLRQQQEDLQLVRESLRVLPANHPLRATLPPTYDCNAPQNATELVDTFLHRRERTYSVSDCLELCAAAEVELVGWSNNFHYYPTGHLPEDSPLYSRINSLPVPQIWQATELFANSPPMHQFIATHPADSPGLYKFDFDTPEFWDYSPRLLDGGLIDQINARQAALKITLPTGRIVILNPAQSALCRHFDGIATIRQCLARSGLAGDATVSDQFMRQIVQTLWRLDQLLINKSGGQDVPHEKQ